MTSPVHEEPLWVVQGATFDFEFRWQRSVTVDDVTTVTAVPIGHMTAALQVRASIKKPVLLEATA